MLKFFKSIFALILPRKKYLAIENFIKLKQWKYNNYEGASPHLIKSRTIKEYQNKYQINILIETGTYLGDMVEAQRNNFSKIISIEISESLQKKATKRFSKYKHIKILHGDSSNILPVIMKDIQKPAIFWLDGHYSAGITEKGQKECPIFEEIDAILNENHFKHILLVDDARCFIGKNDYPTIEELTDYIKAKNNKYQLEIKNDILRFVLTN
jgi:hypothetical protein